MKVAIVHDHLVQDGGAERVAETLLEMFPKSAFFTLLYNKNKVSPTFENHQIRTSFLQKIPFLNKRDEWLLPWMPAATEHHNLHDFNLVISNSSIFSKGVITAPGAKHICYCHTPPRFLWTDSHNYLQELKHNFLIKKFLPLILPRLRQWDRLAADRVDYFVANSQEVQKRIKKYYGRDSVIIPPPIKTENFYLTKNLGNYFIAGGRLVGYKRFDLIINAFNRLNLPLKIFGVGPLSKDLKKMAKNNIQFLGKISEKEKAEWLSRAQAFINPQLEDFGLTAVEAMASGRPVIAYGQGGALETVAKNITGKFFYDQTWEDLAYQILKFKNSDFDPVKIKAHAENFNLANFQQKFQNFLHAKLSE